jgi:hypothetical protein
MTGMARRNVALSADVGVPLPPRACTMLSNIIRLCSGGMTNSPSPGTSAMKRPAALASAISRA